MPSLSSLRSLIPSFLFLSLQADPAPKPAPETFPFTQAPLGPEFWPHHQAQVNRDRVYDFYAKQAEHFRARSPRAELVMEYPGLDGGKHGHWGNQNEAVWRDGRWNGMDAGGVMGGVLKAGGKTVPKAVCVRLGGTDDASVAFNPQSLRYEALWKGGFLRFGEARSGLLDGLKPAGELLAAELPAPPDGAAAYAGYHRRGDRVAFAYRVNGEPWLDMPAMENGVFRPVRGPAATHPLGPSGPAAPPRWPGDIVTRIEPGDTRPFAVDTLPLPFENPWKSLFYLGGHDFFANGDLAVCTIQGDVWIARGVADADPALRWRRFAAGLHQPLGLRILGDRVFVLGRDQITRLEDTDGDGEADLHHCVHNGYDSSPGGHDYITGLETDGRGGWFFVSARQGVCRADEATGQVETLASGFRNPNGIGLSADGTLTVGTQEGDWTPASMLFQVERGGYYGYPGPREGRAILPPLLYLPRGVDNSCGGQVFTPAAGWGPWKDTLVHLSYGAGVALVVLRESVDGVPQGAAYPLPGEFRSGAHRGRFSPADGQLYVSGMAGWGTYTVDDGCLQRLRHTGGGGPLPVEWHARDNGVWLRFDRPLGDGAADAAAHFAQIWNYRQSKAYGSPELSVKHPGVPGHDVLAIDSAHRLEGGSVLFLEIPQLRPAHSLHLRVADGHGGAVDLFATVHRAGPAFTAFPGYTAKAKESWPGAPVLAKAAAAENPWIRGSSGRELPVKAAPGLQFEPKRLAARRGERLTLVFENPDTMPHNWVLLRAGRLAPFTEAAIRFITDPSAADRQYIPPGEEVLAYADMLNPGQRQAVHFNAPDRPGEYPFLCTFPGHSQVMTGVLVVTD